MTETEMELARRLVASPRWRWMPGMRAMSRHSTRRVYGHETAAKYEESSDMFDDPRWFEPSCTEPEFIKPRGDIPDLSDPATQGCLLAMLREAAPHGTAEVRHRGEWDKSGPWHVWGNVPDPHFDGETICIGGSAATYSEALAKALLAAWGEP